MSYIKKIFFSLAGTLFMALSLNIFLDPAGLVTGGATGLGVIFAHLGRRYLPFEIPLWATNLAVNLPLLLWASKRLGKKFVLSTLAATLYLSLFLKLTAFLPLPTYTDDFINAVFGGALMGTGVGLVLFGGASTGGSDLLASILHAKNRRLRISALIFLTDMTVLMLGTAVFGAVKTMYSAVSVYVSSAAVKLISEGTGFARVVFIASDKHIQLADEITRSVKRGATILYGKGAYTNTQKNIVMIVAANREIPQIKRIAAIADPACFMFVSDVREVLGQFR
ncbi:MAG: YitT family protein [Firmicutes bacterium]|nr:YitT family protein [Bacillota bacterium]